MGKVEKVKRSVLGVGDWASDNWRKGLSTIIHGILSFFKALGDLFKR